MSARPCNLLVALGSLGLLWLSSGASAAASKGLTRTSQKTGQAEVLPLRIVAVGVSDFQNLSPKDDLASGAADAAWFVEQVSKVVTPSEKVLLTGPEATSKNVESNVLRVLGGATANDVVMLYFATHGGTVRNNGYLLTWDTQPEGKTAYTSVPTARIKEAVLATKAAQVILFADTVHQQLEAGSGIRTGPESDVDSILGAIGAAGRKEGKDVLVLTANQIASATAPADPCGGHSTFTCAVVSALMGKADYNGDGLASLGEITRAVPVVAMAGNPRADRRRPDTAWGGSGSQGSIAMPVSQLVLGDAPALAGVPQDFGRAASQNIRVCYLGDNQIVPVDHVFHSGETFAARVTVPEDGQLSMVNVGPDGRAELLFPLPGENNRVSGGTSVQVMPGDSDDPIVLVDPVGREKVYIVWSPANEGLAAPSTLLAIAQRRAASGSLASAEAPSPDWQPGMKSLRRTSQIPRVESGETCNLYRPEQQGQGWVVELSLDHR